jgi:hypothetical protein
VAFAPYAPTGRYGIYDAVGNAPTYGFNIAPLVPRWAATWMQPGYLASLPRSNTMPSFSFGTPLNGSSGGLGQLSAFPSSQAGTDWGNVAAQGLNLLGGWAQQRAIERQQKRQLKAMRIATGQVGGPVVGFNPYMTGQVGGPVVGFNPYMSTNPNLGAAPTATGGQAYAAGSPFTPTTIGGGLSLTAGIGSEAPIVPSLPGWPGAYATQPDPAAGEPGGWVPGIFEQIARGALGYEQGGNVATPVTTSAVACRRPGPPRLVGAVDNASGKAFFYRYVGAPILFRGDLATLKTVKKAVSRFGGLAGCRGGRFRRRR